MFNQAFKNIVLQLLLVGVLVASYQNCAQNPYGADGSISPESQTKIDDVLEIKLVNHEDEKFIVGEKVTLTVNYAALGAERYEWYKVVPFQGDIRVGSGSSPTLVINNFNQDNEGDYKVVAISGTEEKESALVALSLE